MYLQYDFEVTLFNQEGVATRANFTINLNGPYKEGIIFYGTTYEDLAFFNDQTSTFYPGNLFEQKNGSTLSAEGWSGGLNDMFIYKNKPYYCQSPLVRYIPLPYSLIFHHRINKGKDDACYLATKGAFEDKGFSRLIGCLRLDRVPLRGTFGGSRLDRVPLRGTFGDSHSAALQMPLNGGVRDMMMTRCYQGRF